MSAARDVGDVILTLEAASSAGEIHAASARAMREQLGEVGLVLIVVTCCSGLGWGISRLGLALIDTHPLPAVLLVVAGLTCCFAALGLVLRAALAAPRPAERLRRCLDEVQATARGEELPGTALRTRLTRTWGW